MPTPITPDSMGFHAFKRRSDPRTFPQDFAAYVAGFGDLYWWPTGKFHVVNRRRHAIEVLKDEAVSADRRPFFLTRMPNLDLSLVQDFFGVVAKMMVMSDGEDHARRRRAAQVGFEDHVIDRFRGKVEASVERLLGAAYAKGRFDFARDVAKDLPCTVLADLFSIPEADRAEFFAWSNAMTAFFGGGTGYENADGIKVNQAARSLVAYFTDLMARRRAEPGDDYMSLLVEGAERFGLGDDEVLSQATMMLVAGMATTSDQTGNNLFQFLRDPDTWDRLAADPRCVPAAVEEATRFDPAVTFLFRVTSRETRIEDYPVPAGATLFLSAHTLNRDFEIERPLELDLGREPVKHFAYGHGAHYCIGAKLGRMEMNLLFERMVGGFPRLEVDPDGVLERDHYSLSFSGWKSLPVRVA